MLSKLAALLLSPLGTVLLLLILAVVSGKRWRRTFTLTALAWLWLWSTPVVSDALQGWVEAQAAQAGPREATAVPPAPMIIVLGGAVGSARPPGRPYPDLTAASDRVWHAARLYHAGKSPRILLSGGSIRDGIPGEAHAMRQVLLALGVPDAALWLEDRSTDTTANAAHSAALLRQQGIQQAILVTSALHMPRAKLQFEQTGLQITAAPTDFEITNEPLDLLALLPSADALGGAARALKEIIGLHAVRWGLNP
jgi:uncharacterized SAM-binding protein YcdF (DUF218 family)